MYFFLLLVNIFSAESKVLVEQGTTIEWHGRSRFTGVFVVTADGKLTYVDIESGEILWTLDTGRPVFNSCSVQGAGYVPTIDGHVISCTKYGFRRIPFLIRDLSYFSPFRTETGEIFTAGKMVSVYFVETDTGKVLSSYTANTTIPLQSLEPKDKKTLTIVRVDYDLNVLTTETTDKIRYSDFDIIENYHNFNEDNDKNMSMINVTTSLNGGIVISKNGVVKSQLRLSSSIPISVFGSNGKFEFNVKNNGAPFPKDSAQILDFFGTYVAVPGAKIKDVSKSNFLIGGLPKLNGQVGSNPYYNQNYLGPGIVQISRPFSLISPIRKVDPNRPANIVIDDPFSFVTTSKFSVLPYGTISIGLLIVFSLLQFFDFIFHYVKNKSYLIKIDEKNKSIGYFNGVECDLVYIHKSDLQNIQDISSIDGIPKIEAIDELDKNEVVIAYKKFTPYNFDESFSPITFLKYSIDFLSTLFKNNYVHGSITKENIYIDSNSKPIFSGFQHTCKKSTDIKDRIKDVKSIGIIINDVLQGNYTDCFLYDLIQEMNGDEDEIPLPEEILKHPLFLTSRQKLDIYKRASDFLHKKDSDYYLKEFDKELINIAGKYWTLKINELLLSEASQKISYCGDLLSDLIRLIRNKHEHKPEGPKYEELELSIGKKDDDDTYFNYFHNLFPNLFLYTYYFLDKYDI